MIYLAITSCNANGKNLYGIGHESAKARIYYAFVLLRLYALLLKILDYKEVLSLSTGVSVSEDLQKAEKCKKRREVKKSATFV